MLSLWTTLLPLALGSALVPMQIVVTVTLLRSPHGLAKALAWTSGMTSVRLLQGLIFGLILAPAQPDRSYSSGPGEVVSGILLVVALVFYVTGLRQLFTHVDEDAPPPRWMAMLSSLTPAKAGALGFGMVVISTKFWIFTLGAVGAIRDAHLGPIESLVDFLIFVAIAEAAHLILVGGMMLSPDRFAGVLDRFSLWLQRSNRVIVLVLSLIFGTWMLLTGLTGLDII